MELEQVGLFLVVIWLSYQWRRRWGFADPDMLSTVLLPECKEDPELRLGLETSLPERHSLPALPRPLLSLQSLPRPQFSYHFFLRKPLLVLISSLLFPMGHRANHSFKKNGCVSKYPTLG